MIRTGLVAALVCLLVAPHDSADAAECDPAATFPCHIKMIDRVQVRLDGSAAELGFVRERVARSVRDHLLQKLPDGVTVRLEPSASPTATKLPPGQRGWFACTLWTVGKHLVVALFVECGLEATNGSWAVESRLLGNVRQSELQESAQAALAMVVADVVRRLPTVHKKPPVISTRIDQSPIN